MPCRAVSCQKGLQGSRNSTRELLGGQKDNSKSPSNILSIILFTYLAQPLLNCLRPPLISSMWYSLIWIEAIENESMKPMAFYPIFNLALWTLFRHIFNLLRNILNLLFLIWNIHEIFWRIFLKVHWLLGDMDKNP